ncbi:DUF6090 family protein [Hyunsoonleella aestuarii]|uniref:Uncharacterized protein n=1 Tax=Hyunsoonleella aestuarii TaxID=912802 RepID=A0ABP8E7Y6_9FLAO|nr:DUF6090 family protein [Hyunsoonleella aestuarii]
MIKFLRKIRYNLVSSGKTSKYLKYAIGEIILVVIGILIALQINNWNENVKARRTEVKLLNELKDDLLKTKEDLLTDIYKSVRNQNVTDSIYLEIMKHRDNDTNLELKISTSYLSDNPLLYPKLSAYKSLQSYGINTINNDSLRKQITEFYELKLNRVNYVESLIMDLNETQFKTYFNRKSVPSNNCDNCLTLKEQFKIYDKTNQNIFILVNPNDEFVHMLKSKYGMVAELERRYLNLNTTIDTIVRHINKDIGIKND